MFHHKNIKFCFYSLEYIGKNLYNYPCRISDKYYLNYRIRTIIIRIGGIFIKLVYYDLDKFHKELMKIKNTKFQLLILLELQEIEEGNESNIDTRSLGEGLYEFSFGLGNNEYRILYFYDKNTENTIILTHGFIKKSRKTPRNEIERAKKIRLQYHRTGIKLSRIR